MAILLYFLAIPIILVIIIKAIASDSANQKHQQYIDIIENTL